ncbi:MerR family transcriptional regulator [Listeria monocytogenes]|nr:MerR family transcriptional regulator [Listeria monocytogenes]
METYTTSQVAKIIGVHPNTVRLYEKWELIPVAKREKNGYRIYTTFHVEVFKIARIAFQIELTQSGLRKEIVKMIKYLAKKEHSKVNESLETYIQILNDEISFAKEAIDTVEDILLHGPKETITLSRGQTANFLKISVDSLRNWELNGLLSVKRSKNGYRVYTQEDMGRLKIIRTLRFANYSLEAILRLLNHLDNQSMQNDEIKMILNTPNPNDEIISVCDSLLISLDKAKANSFLIQDMILKLENKY